MVKTAIKITEKDSEFPKMMIGDDGQVVLFSCTGIGVVVTSGGEDELGEYSEYWEMDRFSDFTGSVTITNEG